MKVAAEPCDGMVLKCSVVPCSLCEEESVRAE